MKNHIRSIRIQKKMTLADVAMRCTPPTTAQTIGRLETGMRTLSIDWLNRIAAALNVNSADLIAIAQQSEIEIAAILDEKGCLAPGTPQKSLSPMADENMMAMRMAISSGEYRAGDEIWLQKLPPTQFIEALNADILVPRPDGRFIFGRLIGRENGRIQILPHHAGQRQQILNDPAWIGRARNLFRQLM
ncbi:transcriptional regulator [Sphingorhabdus lutea]|uniref:Transcriptional regulator n=1 Tax=Sphingorhabdus lutea TaxID=1913578 RepID=A0A1L3JBI4_9SPHN|nr:helix-turn-helix transcriptional regulator [Sphingorhabdus lutea]APG62507.1 transcriptional regulator [Sphingorhabdus lutea]